MRGLVSNTCLRQRSWRSEVGMVFVGRGADAAGVAREATVPVAPGRRRRAPGAAEPGREAPAFGLGPGSPGLIPARVGPGPARTQVPDQQLQVLAQLQRLAEARAEQLPAARGPQRDPAVADAAHPVGPQLPAFQARVGRPVDDLETVPPAGVAPGPQRGAHPVAVPEHQLKVARPEDRKSTRLNSSHEWISYAV